MADEVGTLAELQEFDGAPPELRRPSPALKGIITEIANTGILRYDWKYLQTLILYYLDHLIAEYDAQSQVDIGPPRPLPGNETPAILRQRLRTQLADQFPTEAPFTIQRLAELLLEPQKHYSRLDKLVLALERLMSVTSTIRPDPNPPPRPKLKDLGPVNCNPKPVQMEKVSEKGGEGAPIPARGPGQGGYGLASSFLADHSEGFPQDRPELEEAMGHLNEAGTAAEVAARLPVDKDLVNPASDVPVAQAAGMSLPHANGHIEQPHKLKTPES